MSSNLAAAQVAAMMKQNELFTNQASWICIMGFGIPRCAEYMEFFYLHKVNNGHIQREM